MALTESDLDPKIRKITFLMIVRKRSWAFDLVVEMLLIQKKMYFRPDYSRASLSWPSK